jgi:hypothetical protein
VLLIHSSTSGEILYMDPHLQERGVIKLMAGDAY